MTHLRKIMLEELQRRNYSQQTTKAYLHTVGEFAQYFHRSPDELGPEHIREFQAHLFHARKLSGCSVAQRTAALRFLFVKTLKRADMLEHIPFPNIPLRLPTILSPEEVARLCATPMIVLIVVERLSAKQIGRAADAHREAPNDSS